MDALVPRVALPEPVDELSDPPPCGSHAAQPAEQREAAANQAQRSIQTTQRGFKSTEMRAQRLPPQLALAEERLATRLQG